MNAERSRKWTIIAQTAAAPRTDAGRRRTRGRPALTAPPGVPDGAQSVQPLLRMRATSAAVYSRVLALPPRSPVRTLSTFSVSLTA